LLTLDELKEKKEILNKIDWALTPQEAFEAYQIKSRDGYKYRSLPEVYYFYISVWQGVIEVLLVKRLLKESEVIAKVAVPSHLLKACLAKQGGLRPPTGQYAIDEAIKTWLKDKLGVQKSYSH